MIVQKNFLSKLREFGLNTYESKLWTALLSRGSSTAGELSDIANVPRSRTYDVLESLERKGFIIRQLGKPIKYLAVEPAEVVDRVKERLEEETKKQVGLIEELKASDVLEELSLLHSQGIDLVEPADLTGSITGRDNLYNHIESRIAKATESVLLTTTSAGLMRKMEFLKPVLVDLKSKGVSVKIATQDDKELQSSVKELKGLAEIKHCNVPGRFCVIDGKEITFMLLDDALVHPSYDVGVWVNTQFFANVLLMRLKKNSKA